MLHLNVHLICLLAWHKFYNSISMLVWCMLVVGLNDEMKTSMHRISSDFTSKYFQSGIKLTMVLRKV